MAEVRETACGNPECHGPGREQRMTVVERDEAGKPIVWCDPCIAGIVKALNDAGLKTIASCCGHGFRPGSVVLADGREIIIARDFDEGQKIGRLFPTDINGETNAAGFRVVGPGFEHDIRDRLTKTKGSSWTGPVVGFYSASLTSIGYAIESENEPGNVQVYPAAAIRAIKDA